MPVKSVGLHSAAFGLPRRHAPAQAEHLVLGEAAKSDGKIQANHERDHGPQYGWPRNYTTGIKIVLVFKDKVEVD